jgi:hypothetical protein
VCIVCLFVVVVVVVVVVVAVVILAVVVAVVVAVCCHSCCYLLPVLLLLLLSVVFFGSLYADCVRVSWGRRVTVTFIVFVPGQSRRATPLFAASEHGRIEVVRALLGAGAAVNQAKVRDHDVFGVDSASGCHTLLAAHAVSVVLGIVCVSAEGWDDPIWHRTADGPCRCCRFAG